MNDDITCIKQELSAKQHLKLNSYKNLSNTEAELEKWVVYLGKCINNCENDIERWAYFTGCKIWESSYCLLSVNQKYKNIS